MRYILLFFAFSLSYLSLAQDDERRVIQFSGLIVSGDSAYGVMGAHIYVPKSLRGTATNSIGYFTMPALGGDSVIISCIGYKKQYLILPDGKEKQSYTAIIELRTDTTKLAEISILPYPTLQLFKEALVHANIPKEEGIENYKQNLEEKAIKKMLDALAVSGVESYRYYTLQEIQRIENKYMITTNPLLSPTSWVQLIRAIKNGDFKQKKDYEDK